MQFCPVMAGNVVGFKLKAAELKEQRKNDMWSIEMGAFRCIAVGITGLFLSSFRSCCNWILACSFALL